MKNLVISIILSIVLQTSLFAQDNWVKEFSQTSKTLRSVVAVDTNIVWAAGDSGIVVNTLDGGKNWVVKSLPNNNLKIEGMDAYNEFIAWVVTYNSSGNETALYKTTDGGENWTLKQTSNNTEAWYNDVKFFDENNGVFYGDPEDGYFVIYTTSDGGENWNRVELPEILAPSIFSEYGVVNNMAVSGNSVWFGTQNAFSDNVRIFYSNDLGSTWNFVVIEKEYISSIKSMDFYNELIGTFVSGSYFGKTYDGGLTWSIEPTKFLNTSRISFGTLSSIIAVAPFMGGGYYSEANLSTDGGNTWQEIPTNITDKLYDVSFVNEKIGWAVGSEGVIVKWIGEELPTSIEPKKNTINNYSLYQNYPNPFNPSTQIKYKLAEDGIVTLTIFNILGEKVDELINEYQPAGTYAVEFNAKGLPSGVYFYKLETNDFIQNKKMLLIK